MARHASPQWTAAKTQIWPRDSFSLLLVSGELVWWFWRACPCRALKRSGDFTCFGPETFRVFFTFAFHKVWVFKQTKRQLCSGPQVLVFCVSILCAWKRQVFITSVIWGWLISDTDSRGIQLRSSQVMSWGLCFFSPHPAQKRERERASEWERGNSKQTHHWPNRRSSFHGGISSHCPWSVFWPPSFRPGCVRSMWTAVRYR